jgi:intracellular septation protein
MSLEFALLTAIEFGPLTVFFITSYIYDFYTAALFLVIATIIALIVSVLRYRRFAYFSFLMGLFVLICGSATVLFHDPRWLVIEYTVNNCSLALALLGGYYFLNRPVLRDLFGHMFMISEKGWMILSWRWGMLFLITGVTNQIFWELVRDEYLWTIFRLLATVFIFVFGMSQFLTSRRERLPEGSAWGLRQHIHK